MIIDMRKSLTEDDVEITPSLNFLMEEYAIDRIDKFFLSTVGRYAIYGYSGVLGGLGLGYTPEDAIQDCGDRLNGGL